ncbi:MULTISPECIES: hypothetical protein [unclassified Beijerinckia]|uniref:gp53-like domain-containing protein n=1 Tax=unclassified Beijerinckia TaxID=2638183 RepID=UPI00089A3877|nr:MULTISPECIES: hypothetical protein [unclassified Beijerinckia]MDH7796421.1 hypothetical protein [Beijerinckia sp. GAS462]SEC44372.1 hypothetical protein SAMN05443249_2703 [Beijerinckia sp. 28-YEA-48]
MSDLVVTYTTNNVVVTGIYGAAVGIQGPAGRAAIYGAGAPGPTVGENGLFYIDHTNWRMYGPKAGGVWPAPVSLIGPAHWLGASATAPTVNLAGAPLVAGDMYWSTATSKWRSWTGTAWVDIDAGAVAARNAAEGFATNAAASASQAATDRTAAAGSASSASTSATTATNAATTTSADRVAVAADKSTVAADKATVAADKATVAADKATVAGDKTAAANSATASANSATASAGSATASQNSATAAAGSATAANTSWLQIDKRNLGAKSSAPTLDNQGQALVAGTVYFDSPTSTTKVWTGSAWILAASATALDRSANLSDLSNADTALTNLGATTVGKALLKAATVAAQRVALGFTTAGSTLVQAADTAAQRAVLGFSTIGSTFIQAADAAAARVVLGITSVGSALVTAADAAAARVVLGITSAGSAIVTAADAAAQRTALGISAANTPSTATGNIAATNVQAALAELDSEKQNLHNNLTALAGLTLAANKLPYATGAGALSLVDLTAFVRTLLDDADSAAFLTTLGFVFSMGANGYVKFPNGLLIQWGSQSGGTGLVDTYYPIASPNVMAIFTTITGATASTVTANVYDRFATYFRCYRRVQTSGAMGDASETFFFLVIGST